MSNINIHNITKAYCHGAQFHADDVCSAWLLRKLNSNIEIVRTFKVPADLDDELAFDIGGGQFDHHQKDRAMRDDKIPFAAFGLLWREFGREICPDETAWNLFDRTYVLPVDAYDNGVVLGCTGPVLMFSNAISAFNSNWDDEGVSQDERFEEAVAWAGQYLDHALASCLSKARAKALVDKAIAESDGDILALPRFAPWQEWVGCSTDPKAASLKFAVYYGDRGEWVSQGIPKVPGQRGNRVDFPSEWRGKSPAELEALGLEGVTFVHMAGFLISAKTRENAIVAARKAIEASQQ